MKSVYNAHSNFVLTVTNETLFLLVNTFGMEIDHKYARKFCMKYDLFVKLTNMVMGDCFKVIPDKFKFSGINMLYFTTARVIFSLSSFINKRTNILTVSCVLRNFGFRV